MSRGLCAGVLATTDVEEACKGVAVAVMVGGFPRKAGMERKDVMSKNVSIYKSQAAALEKHAAQGVKVRRTSRFCAGMDCLLQPPTQRAGELVLPNQCSPVFVQDAFGRRACLHSSAHWLKQQLAGC